MHARTRLYLSRMAVSLRRTVANTVQYCTSQWPMLVDGDLPVGLTDTDDLAELRELWNDCAPQDLGDVRDRQNKNGLSDVDQ